jgi:hypothetical protein
VQPERAIAVVLDASRNMSPLCFQDRNTANFVTADDSPNGLFVGFTKTVCDSVPRWQYQRDGLIQALRTTVPVDGSVAVSVVLDAANQVGHGYNGPSVVDNGPRTHAFAVLSKQHRAGRSRRGCRIHQPQRARRTEADRDVRASAGRSVDQHLS